MCVWVCEWVCVCVSILFTMIPFVLWNLHYIFFFRIFAGLWFSWKQVSLFGLLLSVEKIVFNTLVFRNVIVENSQFYYYDRILRWIFYFIDWFTSTSILIKFTSFVCVCVFPVVLWYYFYTISERKSVFLL